MEVFPNIFQITGTVGGRPLQLYLLRGQDRIMLVDSGCAGDPQNLIAPYLTRLGLNITDIDLVFVTHADLDHCGGNAALKQQHPSILLTCGEADRALIEDPQTMWTRRYDAYASRHQVAYADSARSWIFESLGQAQPIDLTWVGGETLRLGPKWVWEIHHTPGHSAGHVILFDPVNKIAIGGDAVHGAVYHDMAGTPALCPTYAHLETYLGSIRYLRQLSIQTYFSAHWSTKKGPEVAAFLDESEQFVKTADAAVRAHLRQRPQGVTLADLLSQIGSQLGEWPSSVNEELKYALAAHLDYLESTSIVTAQGQPAVYRLSA